MERYSGRVVLITGAGDLAQATAKRLLAEGAKVALSDFSKEALDGAVGAITKEGFSPDRVKGYLCDVRSYEDCESVVMAVEAELGAVNTLVATAGIIRHLPIDEMSEKDWQDVVDINLTGVFHAVKSVVPSMKARRQGHIVVISSIGGRTGREVGVNYAATKAGVNGLVINLGYALGPYNITVNSVAPGPLKGRMFATMSPERVQALSAGIRIPRLGELSEIAAAIAYLGSDEAGWTTGEVLDVNGGLQY